MNDPHKCKSFLAGMQFLKKQKYLARSKNGVDFVSQNTNLVAMQGTADAKRTSLERQVMVNEEHMELVKNRRNDQDHEDYKKTIVLSLRWQFLKQKQIEF